MSGDTVDDSRADAVSDTDRAAWFAGRAAAPQQRARLPVPEFAGAVGLTARAVTGVDLGRPELPAHTWAEVFAGEQWIAVDPVYGQAPASVTLLRVVVGGSDRPLVLVPLIGSLKPTTLSIQ